MSLIGYSEEQSIGLTDVNMNLNSIKNIDSIQATKLTGTIQTSNQPNIKSVGKLKSLEVEGDTKSEGNLFISGDIFIGDSINTNPTNNKASYIELDNLQQPPSNTDNKIYCLNGKLYFGSISIT